MHSRAPRRPAAAGAQLVPDTARSGALGGRRARAPRRGTRAWCLYGREAESAQLNARFRGHDKPTNVLSFPVAQLPASAAGAPRPLGELVICPRVLEAEARSQDKTLRAHWAHLVVHGTLHLAGYDHVRAADARRMERREIAVLRRLGFANPYRS